MKVLITGCNGQVGSCLVNLLQNKASVEICTVDRAELDITQQDAVSHYVSSFQPDVIINAAAHTAVDKAEQQNEIGALMLHISTDYVFDGTKETTYVETDLVNPQSIYGITKLAGEEAVAEVCPRHIILRTAWVFSEYGNNFVKTMLGLAKQRDTLGIVADQFGGPTYAGDIAAALIKMAQVITDSNKILV